MHPIFSTPLFPDNQAIAGTCAFNGINFLAIFTTVAAVDMFSRVKLLGEGMSSILNVLKRYHNLRLEWIPGPDELQEGIPYYDCTTVQELVVYTNLNRCGRHLLLEDDLSFARSVWSHVVARANRILYPDMIPHVLFHLIQESINIWTAPSPPPTLGKQNFSHEEVPVVSFQKRVIYIA